MAIHRDEQGKIWLYSDKLGQNVIMRADDYESAIEQILSSLEFFYDLLQAERTKNSQIEKLVDSLNLLFKSN